MNWSVAWRAPYWLAAALALLLSLALVNTARAAETYTVQPGDTLARIARQYGVDLNALATANNLVNPNLIYPGQTLLIPEGDGTAPDEDPPAETAPAPAAAEHVVQRGETLYRIALRYGLTVSDLQQANVLPNSNLIFPGQRLLIPANGAAIAGSTPATEPVPAPPVAAKRIVVHKSEQRAYVYQNGELLWTFVVSTGMPGSETWSGTFAVRSKIPEAYAYNWALRMPYWLGFYHTGYLENGFHALPILSSGAILWDGYLGTPVSYGCVILSYPDAEALYNWADIGTEVVVQP
ncbi:MAG: LysM peptidoglycan-binding domain-containing protein [Anaerolineae bacterium]|nr:LysM peptidoglycan-binding domain-containing protein [Anaerolineae bacterium]